jgi:hypothetical protein
MGRPDGREEFQIQEAQRDRAQIVQAVLGFRIRHNDGERPEGGVTLQAGEASQDALRIC